VAFVVLAGATGAGWCIASAFFEPRTKAHIVASLAIALFLFTVVPLGTFVFLCWLQERRANRFLRQRLWWGERRSSVNDTVDDVQGKQLALDIQELYADLIQTDSSAPVRGINDLSEFFARYIPEGSTFDDAERILRNAGFDVHPRPSAEGVGERIDRFDVFASIFLPGPVSSRIELIVYMRPKSPGDYRTIDKFGAALVATYL